jgi:hypothetical protein
VVASKVIVPQELARVLPPTVRIFAEQFPLSKWFSIGLAIFLLYGPVIGPHADHNGWRYLLGPLICPLLAALYYRFTPPNPYRGYSARYAGLLNLDKRDANAQRFVSLFQSAAARSFVWRAMEKVALVELTVMAIVILATGATGKLNWSIASSWSWQGFIGCCIGSFIAVGSEVFAWVLRKWVADAQA